MSSYFRIVFSLQTNVCVCVCVYSLFCFQETGSFDTISIILQ